jgi:hypothetical protein
MGSDLSEPGGEIGYELKGGFLHVCQVAVPVGGEPIPLVVGGELAEKLESGGGEISGHAVDIPVDRVCVERVVSRRRVGKSERLGDLLGSPDVQSKPIRVTFSG